MKRLLIWLFSVTVVAAAAAWGLAYYLHLVRISKEPPYKISSMQRIIYASTGRLTLDTPCKIKSYDDVTILWKRIESEIGGREAGRYIESIQWLERFTQLNHNKLEGISSVELLTTIIDGKSVREIIILGAVACFKDTELTELNNRLLLAGKKRAATMCGCTPIVLKKPEALGIYALAS